MIQESVPSKTEEMQKDEIATSDTRGQISVI